jgi:hypothetical protein
MTQLRIGDILPLVLCTQNASGASTDTDATPTVILRRNSSTVSPTVSVTNPATGVRNITIEINSAQGWSVGDRGQGFVEYAVGGITQRLGFAFIIRDSVQEEIVL